MTKRVVITGMGVLSSVGNDVPTFWKNLVDGYCGIDFVEDFFGCQRLLGPVEMVGDLVRALGLVGERYALPRMQQATGQQQREVVMLFFDGLVEVVDACNSFVFHSIGYLKISRMSCARNLFASCSHDHSCFSCSSNGL